MANRKTPIATFVTAFALGFASLGASAQSQTLPKCPSVAQNYRQYDYNRNLHPNIAWSVIADMMGVHWSSAQMTQAEWFDPDGMMKAISALSPELANEKDGDSDLPRRPQVYAPIAGNPSQPDVVAYKNAATAYYDRKWAEAVPLFDQISDDETSPYRSAAAYSAARSVIYMGDWKNGIERLNRLLANPSMHEFHQAAYHLIGTLANQSGSAPLIAADLEEIAHLLAAPPVLVCRESQLRDLVTSSAEDLGDIMGIVFPDSRIGFAGSWSTHARDVLDQVAQMDPMIDIVRVFEAPTRFAAASGWIDSLPPRPNDLPGYVNPDEEAVQVAQQDADKLTDHARQQWEATKNPLWGYALAMRTDQISDLGAIEDAVRLLSTREATTEEDTFAKSSLSAQMNAQEVRLLLMAGRIDDAINAVKMAFQNSGSTPFFPPSPASSYVLNGGVRFFLEKQDIGSARRWAKTIEPILGTRDGFRLLDPRLELLLADTWDDVLRSEVERHRDDASPTIPAAFDLLPARKLIEFGQRDSLPKTYRRALLGAGWVRLYLLGNWEEFLALIPEIRENFPELATDLDGITKAWTDRQKHHLVTHLLLRTPGLSPRVLWTRQKGANYGRTRDLFSINSSDPSDGNWWCPLDLDRAKVDLLGEFFVDPIKERGALAYFDTRSLTGGSWPRTNSDNVDPDQDEETLAIIGQKLIEWHPLFRNIDLNELQKLGKIESAPKQLSEEAIAWSKSSNWLTRLIGWDDALPETLHLAIRSTRYGCRLYGGHAEYSQGAYVALHNLFPKSEWTIKTPYWFDKIGE